MSDTTQIKDLITCLHENDDLPEPPEPKALVSPDNDQTPLDGPGSLTSQEVHIIGRALGHAVELGLEDEAQIHQIAQKLGLQPDDKKLWQKPWSGKQARQFKPSAVGRSELPGAPRVRF